jgi:hypothetical protein
MNNTTIVFPGLIDPKGYKWELRPRRLNPDPGSVGTLIDTEYEGEFIVSRSGRTELYHLRHDAGITKKHRLGQARECCPAMDLANAAYLSSKYSQVLIKKKKKEKALAFINAFGMPHGYHEIELEEFHNLVTHQHHILTQLHCSNGVTHPRSKHIEKIAKNGQIHHLADTLIGFCNLELKELIRLGRILEPCEFCGAWCMHRRSSARFCRYGNCRQKHNVTRS